ncbi:MAG: hypothetical protein U5L75_01560 [Candidatus Campbellbacteria bacterium]|nr:hypothetical protein [Candidatus Campbellbacteria bacterium]
MKPEKLQLTVNFIKHGRQVVAYSPALDISTVGKTEKKAKERFEELVDIFFEEIAEEGTTEQALKELGWRKVKKHWQPPAVSQESVDVNVSMPA